MFDSFLAELLALGLVCISCLRMFFTKRAHIDPVAICAPLAFAVAVLALCLWGAEWQLLLTACVSLLVFFTNVRALFRLSAQLYVDHYSILFVSFSILELLAALALGAAAVIFHPVQYRVQDFGVEKTVQYLTGSLQSGYQLRSRLFEPTRITGRLYTYMPEAAESADVPQKPIVLLVPKSTASAVHYEPYCLLLAQKGYTVLTADLHANTPRLYDDGSLFSKDSRPFRRAWSVHRALEGDTSWEKTDAEVTAACYAALTDLALSRYGREVQFFYAVDTLSMELLQPVVSAHEEQVLGFFALNRVAEYTTAGFGFVEQTDPYTAWRLGSWRDATFFIPRYVAGKTDAVIQETLKLLHPVEIIRNDVSKKTGE